MWSFCQGDWNFWSHISLDHIISLTYVILMFLEQGCVATRFKSSLQKYHGHLYELVKHYGVSITPWEQFVHLVIQCSFPFLVHLPKMWHFMMNLVGISWKAEDAYPIIATGPCSWCLVESILLIYFFFCTCMCCVLPMIYRSTDNILVTPDFSIVSCISDL